MTSEKKRIIILGGGFGGVYTARHLGRLLKPDEASVTLINRENYSVYQPMLPEVISGSIGLTDVVSPIRQLSPGTALITREVEQIDLKAKTVTVSPGFRPRSMEVAYDYLVIALGGITDYSGKPGLLEHAKPFRTLADALSLRSHLIHVLEEAELETDTQFRKKLLTFVVAGGGFSGVEVIAELHDFVHLVKDNYPRLRREEIRCVLVHSGDRILPEIAGHLAVFAHKLLAKRGVEIRLLDRLVTATSERAILKSGMEIPTKTIISTVPMAIARVLQNLDYEREGTPSREWPAESWRAMKGKCGLWEIARRSLRSPESPFRRRRNTLSVKPRPWLEISRRTCAAARVPNSTSKDWASWDRWGTIRLWRTLWAFVCGVFRRGFCGARSFDEDAQPVPQSPHRAELDDRAAVYPDLISGAR